MKMVKKLIWIISLAAMVGFSFGSCKDPSNNSSKSVPVTGIALNQASLSLLIGETANLTETVSPYEATNKNVDWTSSNTTVATVDNSGKATAKSAGIAVIIVSTADGGKTATCSVTVGSITLTEIVITSQPIKTAYHIGDELSLSGLEVTATYNNGDTKVIPNNELNVSFNSSTAGTKTVTVIYGGKSATFTVTVDSITLTGIAITSPPSKTEYYVGDTLVQSGLVVTATYNNGDTKVISNNELHISFDSSTAGSKAVAVTYGDKSATFTVTINNRPVTFNSVTANGSSTQTTTQLTLTFSQVITGLTADNITLSDVANVSKGTLSGSGTTYTLQISGFTNSGTLSVTITSPSGYDVSGSPKTAAIFYAIPVTFSGVTANGSSMQTTTELTLTFSQAITGLTREGISLSGVSGVVKGTLSGSGTTYTLLISGDGSFTNGGTLNVTVANLSGYDISGSPKTVTIYRAVPVTLNVTANGSPTQTTTELTLSFSAGVTGLTVDDVTISGVPGVSKGILSGSGVTYKLQISGLTSGSGTLTVAVASPSGYNISGSPMTVTIYSTTYTVTFNANGGSGTVPDSQAVRLNYNITVPSGNGLSRSGYTFGGWNTNSSGTGNNYFAGSSYVLPGNTTDNVNLYARWVMPVDVDMVRINAGTFTIGSPVGESGRFVFELQHQVTLTAGFYMGKYQVTQEQYEAVMGKNPSFFQTSSGDDNPAKRPVEQVSWGDAIEFCNRLSVINGLSPAYRISGSTNPDDWGSTRNNVQIIDGSNGYRLPTEAQWEYACRAGTTTTFNTGNNITTDQANYDGSKYPYNGSSLGIYRERTTEVGIFASNAWGLYDMHGNVSEWCWDWFQDFNYISGPQTNPVGPSSANGCGRVFRGGGWSGLGEGLRSASRGYALSDTGDTRDKSLGFRLVRP